MAGEYVIIYDILKDDRFPLGLSTLIALHCIVLFAIIFYFVRRQARRNNQAPVKPAVAIVSALVLMLAFAVGGDWYNHSQIRQFKRIAQENPAITEGRVENVIMEGKASGTFVVNGLKFAFGFSPPGSKHIAMNGTSLDGFRFEPGMQLRIAYWKDKPFHAIIQDEYDAYHAYPVLKLEAKPLPM